MPHILEAWKALLNQIYPGAAAPGVSLPLEAGAWEYREPPKEAEPLKRIHLMRKIKSQATGFARLYGAKDLEQFRRQIVYMQDFSLEGEQLARSIAFTETMPVYADMSVAQLQWYFQWRTKVRNDIWEPAQSAYAMLYLSELLNFPGNTAAIAQAWLHLREQHSRLDLKLKTWFVDYYLCYAYATPFYDVLREYDLEQFYPAEKSFAGQSIARQSSYAYRESRLFHEQPALLPVLEQAVAALLRNLEPLFRLYALPMEGLLYLQPTRFSFYELFRETAVQPPACEGERVIALSPNEQYRLRGGSWARATQDAFRPPSHGIGYLVKRAEACLRKLVGFRPFNDSAAPPQLLDRWVHGNEFHLQFLSMIEDNRFAAIIDECVGAAWEGAPTDGLLSQADAVARELETEPLRTLLHIKDVTNHHWRLQFQAQARLLQPLEDAFQPPASCKDKAPTYAAMSIAQLRTFLTWRTQWQAGRALPTQTAYATLYCCELLCGAVQKDCFAELCRFLRDYAALHDKTLARRLSGWIKDDHILHSNESFAEKLRKNKMEQWFPLEFLLTDCPQLLLFDHISSYKFTKSRFFDESQLQLYQDCFQILLQNVTKEFEDRGFDLPKLLREPSRSHREADWKPLRGLPVPLPKPPKAGVVKALRPDERYLSNGREWICIARPALPTWAATFAAFLLKRMEQGLRVAVNDPYPLSAQSTMFENVAKEHKKLHTFLCSSTLPKIIDTTVSEFALSHEVRAVRVAKLRKETKVPSIQTGPIKIIVDFAQLSRIRAEAREVTEHLMIEEEEKPEKIVTKLQTPEKIGWDAFRSALSESKIACINAVLDGICENEMLLEQINELSLEYIGDNLIDTATERPYLYEEYVSKWREGQ